MFYLLINPLSYQLPNGKPKLLFSTSSSIVEVTALFPDIRINFHQEITTYNHGFAFWMVDVIWNNGTASGNSLLRTNSGVIFPPQTFPKGVFAPTISFCVGIAWLCSFISSKRWFHEWQCIPFRVMIPCFA
jgi:hypothetical protein